jgi:beta-phosphoglucomutase-like phosphatase (HAD superfamily)
MWPTVTQLLRPLSRHGRLRQPRPPPSEFGAVSLPGVEPDRCRLVEDSVNGVRAARAARVPALADGGGLTPRDLLAGPPTVVFEDVRDLPNLIERRCTP